MTKEETLIQLRYLSLPDKMSVLAVLTRMIEQEEQDIKYKNEVELYLSRMKELVGRDFTANNKQENVSAKIVFSVCLLEKGFSLVQVGRILGRDHSTISSYKRTWNDALIYPRVYKDMIELYNNYKKMI